MRLFAAIALSFVAVIHSASAQDHQPPSSVTREQREAVSDEKAASVRALIAAARKRQEIIDRQNTDLWARWTYAVCIGCGPVKMKGVRIVHTYPHRVLQGIPAAMDDARERRGLRV